MPRPPRGCGVLYLLRLLGEVEVYRPRVDAISIDDLKVVATLRSWRLVVVDELIASGVVADDGAAGGNFRLEYVSRLSSTAAHCPLLNLNQVLVDQGLRSGVADQDVVGVRELPLDGVDPANLALVDHVAIDRLQELVEFSGDAIRRRGSLGVAREVRRRAADGLAGAYVVGVDRIGAAGRSDTGATRVAGPRAGRGEPAEHDRVRRDGWVQRRHGLVDIVARARLGVAHVACQVGDRARGRGNRRALLRYGLEDALGGNAAREAREVVGGGELVLDVSLVPAGRVGRAVRTDVGDHRSGGVVLDSARSNRITLVARLVGARAADRLAVAVGAAVGRRRAAIYGAQGVGTGEGEADRALVPAGGVRSAVRRTRHARRSGLVPPDREAVSRRVVTSPVHRGEANVLDALGVDV